MEVQLVLLILSSLYNSTSHAAQSSGSRVVQVLPVPVVILAVVFVSTVVVVGRGYASSRVSLKITSHKIHTST